MLTVASTLPAAIPSCTHMIPANYRVYIFNFSPHFYLPPVLLHLKALDSEGREINSQGDGGGGAGEAFFTPEQQSTLDVIFISSELSGP